MAQTETEWRKEQEEKARQYEEAVPADHPAGYTESEMYLRFASQLQNIYELLTQMFRALAGLAFLFALQALALAALIWKVARL